MAFQHPSEEFVFRLCRNSFLSLWSYANPRKEESTKELCDILVVCDPYVLIFSVKYSEYKETADPQVAANRWLRATVEDSVKGIYGAQRNLTRATHVTRSDGQPGLPLPPLAERRIHRISVSLGGRRRVNLSSGDFGKGFVHCFDDQFVVVALGELNTVTDFIAYLEAKEHLFRERRVVMKGGEEDLLAVYLSRGRKFPEAANQVVVEDNQWESFLRNAAYQRRLKAEHSSYIWDKLIEYFAEHVLAGSMEFGATLSENELVLRAMARENRLARRILGGDLRDFLLQAQRRTVRARMALSPGVTYVFFNAPPTFSREERVGELGCRCIVARNEIRENATVIGLGLNTEPAPQGFAEDLIFMFSPEWTSEQQAHAEAIKKDFGFFEKPVVYRQRVDEYPEE